MLKLAGGGVRGRYFLPVRAESVLVPEVRTADYFAIFAFGPAVIMTAAAGLYGMHIKRWA